ncbi:glycosyltransferase [Mucilaginibacter sp. PAMC 26640]|nr:glycosyltransferase [Mucilaginibacter sp. PAMC 26640]
MNNLKISIITVSYNAGVTIERCIRSVIEQSYNNIQYIIIDGASGDDTMGIVAKYSQYIDVVVSETDHGIYDAMNKGIRLAKGDVVGMLNADDTFTDANAVTDIAAAFTGNKTDILYADLNYLKQNGIVFRKWVSGEYKHGMFNKGWMPPHPTFYCKREIFKEFGNYSLQYGTAADYELMLRFIHVHKMQVFYLNRVLVNMYTGGVSNNSYRGRAKVLFLDFIAMRKNKIKYPVIALFLKRLTKIKQFF